MIMAGSWRSCDHGFGLAEETQDFASLRGARANTLVRPYIVLSENFHSEGAIPILAIFAIIN
jgi:hypothetical protein